MKTTRQLDFSPYTERYLKRLVSSRHEPTSSLLWHFAKSHLKRVRRSEYIAVKDGLVCCDDDVTFFAASYLQYHARRVRIAKAGFRSVSLTVEHRLSDYDKDAVVEIYLEMNKDGFTKSHVFVDEKRSDDINALLLQLGSVSMAMDFKRFNKL